MYIEQVDNKKFNPILYILPPFAFFGLMIVNYFSSKDVNVEEIMQQMIQTIGVNGTFLLVVGPLAAALLILLFWVKFLHQQSLTSLTTSRKKIDWRRVLFSFSLWAAVTLLMTGIAFYLSPEDFVVNFNPSKFFVFLILAIVLIPMQTSFEEYFFRGYLMQGLGVVAKNRWLPLIFTSVTFGVMHIANPEVGKLGMIVMVYYIGTGFFLGIITLMDEGLELALGFHAANNLVGALLVTADWTAFQTHSILKDVSEPSAGYDILFPVLVLFPILLVIFGKKYGWKNWKEKLTGKLIAVDDENENGTEHLNS